MGRDHSACLLAIYDAALSDQHWPRALKLISHEIDAVGSFIVAVDQVGLPFHIQSSTYPVEQLRSYIENYSRFDEQNFSALAAAPTLRLLRDCDVADVSRFEGRGDYMWMRENIGARRKAAVRLNGGKGWSDVTAFQFREEWAASTEPIQNVLDVLLPHLAKVVEVNRKFMILRAQYNAAIAALDRVRIGACIAGPKGEVIVANREAQRIFSLDDGLSLSKSGYLACSTADASAELTSKIAFASRTARGDWDQHEAILLAQRKTDARAFVVELAPLRDSTGELEPGLTGTLVFIIDPENQSAISIQKLVRLCGLTDAEAKVCHQMVSGRSSAEIARERGVSEDTVRSQFKAVYAKTGVRRRADLVRLAVTVDPPIG